MYDKIKSALDQFGPNAESLGTVILSDLVKYSGAMSDALNNNDVQSALLAAHSCKSIFALIQVEQAHQIAQTLENEATEGNLEAFEEIYPELSKLINDIQIHLKEYLK